MLKKGMNILAELFPDYSTKLEAAGARPTDIVRELSAVHSLQSLAELPHHALLTLLFQP